MSICRFRNDLPEIFDAFDFTNPHTTTGARPKTTGADSGFVYAERRHGDGYRGDHSSAVCPKPVSQPLENRIQRMFQLIVSDSATDNEQQAMLSYVQQTESRLQAAGDAEASLKALTMACMPCLPRADFSMWSRDELLQLL